MSRRSGLSDYDHYQELNGVTAFVLHVSSGGQILTVTGWTPNRRKFKEGDRILFRTKDGQESRYRIVSTDFPRDPTDQYFLKCTFYPRTAVP